MVVTHAPPPDWAPAATAPYEFLDGADVSVARGRIAGQALSLGLVDEVQLQLAPVVLGRGKPFFAGYDGPELVLEEPEVILGTGVVHPRYRVPSERR